LRSGAGRSVVGSLPASGGLQLIVIVRGVLVARSLGLEDRGYLALLIVIAGVFALGGMLGLPSAVTYYIVRDPAQARRVVSSLAWVGVLPVRAVFVLQALRLQLSWRPIRGRPSGGRYLPSPTARNPRSKFRRRDPPGAAPVYRVQPPQDPAEHGVCRRCGHRIHVERDQPGPVHGAVGGRQPHRGGLRSRLRSPWAPRSTPGRTRGRRGSEW
jgi:hypothetical protein